ncbi:MAG: hypothetical protein K0U78_02880 [Actinomycetia bacterium]|nr:hypothetical protein [Actinomycetes bacterium]
MAPSSRVKIAVISALVTGGALAAASQAGAQPMPVDPALPPTPGVAAPTPPAPGDAGTPTRNQVFTYTPIGEGGAVEGPPPAPPPPPGTAPYIPPVPNADFNNTGQMSYLRELWNMRSPEQLFGALNPSDMDPATADAMGVRQMPMLPPGTLPPGATAADYPMLAPGTSPPDVTATDMPMLPPGALPPGVAPPDMPMPPPDVAALEMSVLEEVLPPGVLPPEAPAVASPAPPPGAPPAPASAPPPVWPPVGMMPAP